MKYLQVLGWLTAVLLLSGCGTRIEIKDCDSSLIYIDQNSTQDTDTTVPISPKDAPQILTEMSAIPKIKTN